MAEKDNGWTTEDRRQAKRALAPTAGVGPRVGGRAVTTVEAAEWRGGRRSGTVSSGAERAGRGTAVAACAVMRRLERGVKGEAGSRGEVGAHFGGSRSSLRGKWRG